MITDLFRAIGGCSPAAAWALVTRGPGAARKVMGGTVATLWPKPGAPAMSFWDIARAFAVDEELIIHAGSWQDGCTAPLERFVTAQLLHYFKPKRIVEVGAYRGTTTRLFLDNMSPDARVYTIDLPPETDAAGLRAVSDERLIIHRKPGAEYVDHPRREAVTRIFGDTFDPRTWEEVPQGIDFAFIDASHSYEAVRNDTERLWPKLSENAVILWHDYTETVSPERGVGRYIRELMQTKKDIFLCSGTDMAIRIPQPLLIEAAARVPGWHPSGDYFQRNPLGPLPWQSKSSTSTERRGSGISPGC
jgi:predicted O-methyltransferase YrrM